MQSAGNLNCPRTIELIKNNQTARIILEKLTEDKRTNNHRLESIMRKRPIKIKSGKNTLIDKITSQGNPEGVSERRLHLVLHVTPRDLQRRIHSETSLGRPKDVNIVIIHKMGFYDFFLIFLDSNCLSDIVLPSHVRNLILPILVLLRSETSRPKQDQ